MISVRVTIGRSRQRSDRRFVTPAETITARHPQTPTITTRPAPDARPQAPSTAGTPEWH